MLLVSAVVLTTVALQAAAGPVEIRAAVILPSDYRFSTSLPKVMSAVDIAVQHVYRAGILRQRDVVFKFVQNDDKCEDIEALRISFQMMFHNGGVDLFLGPTCDYGVDLVARMIKSWNVPLLTAGGLTSDFSQDKQNPKSKYYLLVRTGTLAFQHIANMVANVLDRYSWKKVLIIYEIDGYLKELGKQSCGLMVRTLVEKFKVDSIVQYDTFELSKNPQNSLVQNLRIEVSSKFTGT
ncbi:atrial natriuretic peptide receptor 3 isoform X2 [Daktulosphaira vitifoliae]|uniref:atrial natriuretic peptide receptor 3 isoform X2 n=1 Tax=Daktulosphaira vitifoliae TaxID=58002 RepID=UPI0021AA4E29|nr:atrial natriuretic peptide receptor 3 isoform X2 [Daktulosphaira vitifoliae]